MSFYTSIGSTALTLISKYGQAITLSRTTGATRNPVTGVESAGVDASVTTHGILRTYPDSMIDGTRVLASDRMLILTNEQTPQPTDKPIIGGQEWAIAGPDAIKTVSPAGTDVIYFVQVRR